jgi:exo-beta-1,3-glucanase (GH17 family)
MTQTSPSIRGVMTANGDGSKLLWLTEAGAPTNGPGAVATCSNYNYGGSPDHVDDCLQSLILTQVVQNVKAVSWDGVTFFYSYQDNNSNDPSTVENHFGIVRSNGSQKPSYAALKNSLQ